MMSNKKRVSGTVSDVAEAAKALVRIKVSGTVLAVCVVVSLGCASSRRPVSRVPNFTSNDATGGVGDLADPSPDGLGYEAVAQVAHFTLSDQTCNDGCVACDPAAGCLHRGNASNAYGTTGMAGVGVRVYDPQEFICDGGDHDPQATVLVGPGRPLGGLNPEDTIAVYQPERAPIETTASNRVCLYAPRFGSVRQITGAVAGGRAVGVVKIDRPVGPQNVDLDLPSLVAADTIAAVREELIRGPDSFRDHARGVPVQQIVGPLLAADIQPVLANLLIIGPSKLDAAEIAILQRGAIAANIWSIDESVEVDIASIRPPVLTRDERVEELVVYDFPGAGRLELIKLADRHHAAPGDTVTFTLVMKNVGDSTVRDVSVTDNLTARLQYVVDSEKSDREAAFKTVINDVSSATLTWALAQPLKVGESVTITFEAVVR